MEKIAATNTFIGQKTNPFYLMSMDLKELEKNKIDINEKDNQKEYISSLSSKYQNEISSLKNYIQKMNTQIRKHLNMDILPSLEEGFSSFSQKMKNGEELNEEYNNVINEWLNKLLNVDYINPLITLYDNYIKTLEDELNNSKEINKKYENIITKLVNENNDLRNNLQINEEELKKFLEVRNEAGSMIITDLDYVRKLEERNQLLSKENEILIVNYNKLQNDFIQIKSAVPNINIGNDKKYEKLNEEYLNKEKQYNNLKNNFEYTNQKFKEIIEQKQQLENDNFQLNEIIKNKEKEIEKYKEGEARFSIALNKK